MGPANYGGWEEGRVKIILYQCPGNYFNTSQWNKSIQISDSQKSNTVANILAFCSVFDSIHLFRENISFITVHLQQ